MKIAVFGSTGFIGKNIIANLDSKYTLQEISLRSNNWRDNLTSVDVYFNAIGKAHDHDSKATDADYEMANVLILKEVFLEFLKSDATLFIHISSIAAVEEFESVEPILENFICRPQSIYGKSKRAAEEWLIKQTLTSNKKLIIIRPPMIHGKGDKGTLGLLYKFISKGLPYPLQAYDNKRSFISVDNLIFFLEKIIDKHNIIPSGIYHVSDNEAVSLTEIITIIEQITGRRGLRLKLPKFIVEGVARIGDIFPLPLNTKRLRKMTSNLLVSNEKICKALDIIELPLSAEEGLKRTISSLQK